MRGVGHGRGQGNERGRGTPSGGESACAVRAVTRCNIL